MNYIIFEDKKTNLLSPFCDLHASFELRTGLFSNFERILLQTLNSDTVQLYVRKEIELIVKEKYPDLDINPKIFRPGIYLNGAGILDMDSIKLIQNNLSYSNNNSLIAFQSDNEIQYSELNDYIDKQASV